MVLRCGFHRQPAARLSVLALSSRFDGLPVYLLKSRDVKLSVLALSSRFDGQPPCQVGGLLLRAFSTRSVESF